MPVNAELAGRSYPAAPPYLVGREKVREFARAVLATTPLNLDPEAARAAGYADVVAPPTFAVVVQEHTLGQLLADPDAGIDFARVVHGDQRFRFTRPIVAGDELTGTLTVLVPPPNMSNIVSVIGGSTTIKFGSTNAFDTTNAFILQSCGVVNGTYTNVLPVPVFSVSGGGFQVTTPNTSSDTMFYRLLHVQ